MACVCNSSSDSSGAGSCNLLWRAVNTVLKEKLFKTSTPAAASALEQTQLLLTWMSVPANHPATAKIEQELVSLFSPCFESNAKSEKTRREKMWILYHGVRTSESYQAVWASLMKSSGFEVSPVVSQFIGDRMFKELIKKHYSLDQSSVNVAKADSPETLTLEETYGLRYAAGFIVRSLRKNMKKSAHPLKEDILLCMFDLLDEGEETKQESQNWVDSIDRGGLTLVNNSTFELFVAMEHNFRKFVHRFDTSDFEAATEAILSNEDVSFLWSILSSDWEESSATALLVMIVKEWVKIRGFSIASAWVEKYKVALKQTTQKSKGIRKQLV